MCSVSPLVLCAEYKKHFHLPIIMALVCLIMLQALVCDSVLAPYTQGRLITPRCSFRLLRCIPRLSDAGAWILADVRLKEQYESGHAEGAVSVPIYEVGFRLPSQ